MRDASSRWMLIPLAIMCGAGCQGPLDERTITAAQALARIEGYVEETKRSVPTRLKFSGKEVEDEFGGRCVKDPSNKEESGFTGQVQPFIKYTTSISTVDEEEAHRFRNAVASYWQRKSAEVSNFPDLLTIHPRHDEYRLWVSYDQEIHKLDFGGALDECIWRDGTPHPTDDP